MRSDISATVASLLAHYRTLVIDEVCEDPDKAPEFALAQQAARDAVLAHVAQAQLEALAPVATQLQAVAAGTLPVTDVLAAVLAQLQELARLPCVAASTVHTRMPQT
jgi:hypothetical protein